MCALRLTANPERGRSPISSPTITRALPAPCRRRRKIRQTCTGSCRDQFSTIQPKHVAPPPSCRLRAVPTVPVDAGRDLLALALCVAIPAPIAANANDGVSAIHKHRVRMHPVVHGSFNPAATALAPRFTMAPAAPATTSDDGFDGLSRDPDKCTYGCIDNGH